jgi:hypothetical protein
MIRTAAAIALCTLAASCAASGSTTRLDLRENSYILVDTSARRGTCYTRFVNALPTDQVCQRRNQVRYSPDPQLTAATMKPVPPYVMALFEAMPRPEASGEPR